MGEIKSDLRKSNWRILRLSGKQSFIQLRSEMLKVTGTISTPYGRFKVILHGRQIPTSTYKGYLWTTECNVTNSNGKPCFTIIWVNPTSNPYTSREYRIDSLGRTSLFHTFTTSACLIDTFFSKRVYDHTPHD